MSWKTTLGNAAAQHATLLLLTEESLSEDASALHLLPGVELQPAATWHPTLQAVLCKSLWSMPVSTPGHSPQDMCKSRKICLTELMEIY